MFLALCLLGFAHAEIVRHGIIVSSSAGGPKLEDLRYTQRDADRFADVLTELGEFSPTDLTILTDPAVSSVRQALVTHAQVASAHPDDLFVFYYSGHADGRGLLLGEETLSYELLRQEFRNLDAEVRVGVLDSCRSGEITRTKGLTLSTPFPVDTSLDTEGEAWLTAASAGEDAQESDTLQGSFFTHYLVSGLRGAADSGDGSVSLAEAYAYAYDRTVARTGSTTTETQHPSYDFRLQGSGDLALTSVHQAEATLTLPEEMAGQVLVLRLPSELPVAEIAKEAGSKSSLGLPAGTYLLRVNEGEQPLEARVGLQPGSHLTIPKLVPTSLARTTSKGVSAQRSYPSATVDRPLVRTLDQGMAFASYRVQQLKPAFRSPPKGKATVGYGVQWDGGLSGTVVGVSADWRRTPTLALGIDRTGIVGNGKENLGFRTGGRVIRSADLGVVTPAAFAGLGLDVGPRDSDDLLLRPLISVGVSSRWTPNYRFFLESEVRAVAWPNERAFGFGLGLGYRL